MTGKIKEIPVDPEAQIVENKEYLKKLEELAKDRYTEKDANFIKYKNKEPPLPPLHENFAYQKNRNYNHQRHYNQRN